MGIEAAIIAGTVASAAIGAGSQMMTNSANKEMADYANRQNQRNADTAHQREVADLRRAGLNPILSASGAGAPVPQMQVPEFQNPGSSVADAFSKGITNYSALQNLRQLDSAIQKVQSEAKLNEALTVKAVADTSTAQSVQKLNDAKAVEALSHSNLQGEQIRSLKSSPFMSKLLGTDAASPVSSFMTKTGEKLSQKLDAILSDVSRNTAKSVGKYNPQPRPANIPKPARGESLLYAD